MKDEIIIDDTDYQYEQYLKLCTRCHKEVKFVTLDECKSCHFRNNHGRITNVEKPLWNSRDLMDQRGLQYE